MHGLVLVCRCSPQAGRAGYAAIPAVTVHLRPWRDEDAEALHTAVATTPDLHHQLGGADLKTTSACLDFIRRFLAATRGDTQNFAIVVNGGAVGNVGVSNIERRHDTGWTYYWVAAQQQRQGLATRGLNSLAHWAFHDAGLFRLELGHRVNNPSSCTVATRAGFAAEGVERSKLRYGDERFDVELHARLFADPAPDIPVLPYRLS